MFDEVKASFEVNGWVYEEGDSADPVIDPQWLNNPVDEYIYIGVWLSSTEELEENQMVVRDGITGLKYREGLLLAVISDVEAALTDHSGHEL